ncbi:hypothetical protein SCG7086_AB_00210 [Chlamydiales bacterium SCGC AG-110-P3]|nr:hypothetical protein SCG7086_AB_00210 [Chlamydiales bacterium SCGC AG-110-P3]
MIRILSRLLDGRENLGAPQGNGTPQRSYTQKHRFSGWLFF